MPRDRERARLARELRKREARLMRRSLDLVDEALSVAEASAFVHEAAPDERGFDARFSESLEIDGQHAMLVRAALAQAFGVRVDHRLLEEVAEAIDQPWERGRELVDGGRAMVVSLADDDGGFPTFGDGADEFVLVALVVVVEPERLVAFPVIHEPNESGTRLFPPMAFERDGARQVFELAAAVTGDDRHENTIVARDQDFSAACVGLAVAAMEWLRSPDSAGAPVHDVAFSQLPAGVLGEDVDPKD